VTFAWAVAAVVVFVASFVLGLAGFGIGLVALAFLPFVLEPADAIVLMTIYAVVFALGLFIPLRRHFRWAGMIELAVGTAVGTPLGVWLLTTLPASVLVRLIGVMLITIVLLEWLGLYPERLPGRGWALGAGMAAGIMGGAVGTPGPPVILYTSAQGWSPRTIKANLQAFIFVNQIMILAGYGAAGLVTRHVGWLALTLVLPAVGGVLAGAACFNRIDATRFRRLVFALLFGSGVVLLLRG
jgi:uncharacterized protein